MGPSWLWGKAQIRFVHAPSTVTIESAHDKPQTLIDLVRETTPPCYLNPFLFNGHLQTFWTAVSSASHPIYYKRHVFEAELPAFAGTFAVDFSVAPFQAQDASLPPRTVYFAKEELDALGDDSTKPMLIVLHGLSGGSHEVYLRSVIEPLIQQGWDVCVVISRGCAKSQITTGILYNARATWDIRQLVRWIRERWPRRKLFGLGFSLGANILTNYLAEEGESCLLSGAVVCSNPWNLEVASVTLQQSWLGLNVYSRVMAQNMKALFETHVDQIAKNPRVDAAQVRSVRYLHQFDRALQGPTWGYPSEGAYYRDASSCDSLLAIRVPLLAINAVDDPIAVKQAIPWIEFQQNPFCVLCTTSRGGHLSWFELGGSRWLARPVSQFLERLSKTDHVQRKASTEPVKQLPGVSSGFEPPAFTPMHRRMNLALGS